MIHAQLVRVLHEAEMPLKHLFPADIGEDIYADFPPSTQDGIGWGKLFQDYMDSLYENKKVELPNECVHSPPVLRLFGNTNSRIGNLFFPSAVALTPKRRFGVPGHHAYVFVSDNEISILSPAQSTFFDQILDIELHSIQRMAIIIEAESQKAFEILLEMAEIGENACFLDSDRIELRHISLRWTKPDHVDAFKKEMIGLCPDLEVIDIDNIMDLNPTSSDTRRPPSQMSDEVIVGAPEGRRNENPQLKASHGAQPKANSIPETQMDVLQDSVKADTPVAQDEDDDLYSATPRIAKEVTKATLAETKSASKSTVPPRTRKAGVKPKAKVPIVQRNLRSNPIASASQGTNGKQAKSEPHPISQRFSANQAKARKTQSTRSSQITDDIEDPEVEPANKRQSKGAQKASIVSTSIGGIVSKSVPSQPNDGKKDMPQRTSQVSQTRMDVNYQQLNDDFITSTDELAASALKVAAAANQTRDKAPAPSSSNTQTKKSSKVAAISSQKKRYSLNLPTKSTEITVDEFDFPVNGDDDEVSQKAKAKKVTNARKATSKTAASAKVTSKTGTEGTKADAKKRQSAPAALGQPAATRNSQRVAAAKANEQLRNADRSDAEQSDVEEPVPPKPKTTTKEGKSGVRAATKAKVTSRHEVAAKAVPAINDELEMSLPQQVAVRNNSIGYMDAEELHEATSKQQLKKPATKTLGKSVIKDGQGAANISKPPSEKKRNSGLDLASKLGDLLGHVSDNPPELEFQNLTVGKELDKSAEPHKRKLAKTGIDDVLKASEVAGSADRKSIRANYERETPVVEMWEISDDSSSLIGELEQSAVSPSQANSKADREKTFRKPDIPTRPKDTPKQTGKGESFASKSKQTDTTVNEKTERNMVLSEVIDDNVIEAAQDTSIEIVDQDTKAGIIKRKRKADQDVTTTPKRQCASQASAKVPSSPPSSPPIIAKPRPKQLKKLQKPTENISPPRRSPRLLDQSRKAAESLHQATANETSMGKDPDRKPHLVSFGSRGALNQGISSTTKADKARSPMNNVPEEEYLPIREGNRETKRKRERRGAVDPESPPKKRQSISPSESTAADAYGNGDFPVIDDSLRVETIKTTSTQTRRRNKPPTRPSSQASRVDKNGSPIASSQEDHFGKLRERLAENRRGNKSQVLASASVEPPVTLQPHRLSEVFGPKVVLETKPKGRFSSPKETATRYVAHEKTTNGAYQEVATKQVVAPEKKLQDPFTEHGRKSNGFTERLMSDSSTGKHTATSNLVEAMVELTLPLHKRKEMKPNRVSKPAQRTQQDSLREGTRIEVESQQSLPSDMTMGTSYESQSSGSPRMALSERPIMNNPWNVAVRPHYANIHEAIHKIADVSTISYFNGDC
jgi:hypothetical protein